ncbi:T-cell surface glycoprotein CD8 alpha chain-like [Camarhynchus parvulus]|uniref:T-cell surface glycoprotein CD8 alpha chain-like n=1 Tax=Geospiza parvula TaxID=87175 RepID=UPI0012381CE0|nr:T-cell surface glycoprotein CD8 alpha chain-like [Camarhynchus parvulus]
MDTSPALLLLLTLAFCCPGMDGQSLQIKVRSPKDISQLRVGQKLELECHTDKNHGASWIRQDRSGTLHFIVFINSISRATFEGNRKTSTRFEASKDSTIHRLAVKSFTPQDQGSYFCVMNFNQMLHFSPGQRAFLPVTTTVAPSTPAPTTQGGTTEGDSCLKTPDPRSRMQEDLDSFCLVFLWLPSAGLCLLLLQLLATTIVLHQLKVAATPSRCTSGLKPQPCP